MSTGDTGGKHQDFVILLSGEKCHEKLMFFATIAKLKAKTHLCTCTATEQSCKLQRRLEQAERKSK
jgi:hypothetical protein